MAYHVLARSQDHSVPINVGCLDLAVALADWLPSQGWRAEIKDGFVNARTPTDEEHARVLTRAWAESTKMW